MTGITLVSAFFDIDREKRGDGRRLEEYKEWIKCTLQLNCNLYIITEPRFIDFMKSHRPSEYHHKTVFKADTLENAIYYKYLPRMQEIINSTEYKSRIMHPTRVECNLAEYNVIQYSKFGWLLDAIKDNLFQSDYFFWIDIGISRFFENMDLSVEYPRSNIIQKLLLPECRDKFIIQQRHDLQKFPIDNNFIWRSDNLVKGGIFGGSIQIITNISEKLEKVFNNVMLDNNCVNNEQLGLAIVWNNNKELFHLIPDNLIKQIDILQFI
jgi:hypothetical protein